MSSDEPRKDIPRLARLTDAVSPAWMAAGTAAVAVAVICLLWLSAPQRLPDFDSIERIPARKQAFFEYLAPIVRSENERIAERRRRLLELAEAGSPGWFDRRWLARLSSEYEVEWDPDAPLERIDLLIKRVDIVPVALALVQAATESGWGRSRFAVEGNNLFGHWCYRRGCGIIPARRSSDAGHEVAAFDSVRQSVARYLHNLNTHDAYEPLRRIRARLRRQDRGLDAVALAEGLESYSERREAYVEEIKTVIRVNRPILERIGASL